MNETLVRDALRAHVVDGEPPMGLTSTQLVRAGRRAYRRRVVACAGGAVAVVVGGASALGLTLPREAPAQVASRPPACTGERPERLSDDWVAAELSCVLGQALPRLLPADSNLLAEGGRPAIATHVDGGAVRAVVTTSDEAGIGSLTFAIAPVDPVEAAAAFTSCAGKGICTVRPGPHGETVNVFDTGAQPDGGRNYTVYVYSGGTWLLAGASNTTDGRPTRPEPPLSVDQLVVIATDPALRLY